MEDMDVEMVYVDEPIPMESSPDFIPLSAAPMEKLQELSVVELLLYFNATVNELNGSGFSPILIAAETGNLDSVKTLMKYGANIHHRTPRGSGILHLAASSGDLPCVKFLLDLNLEVDLNDNRGFTPLCVAASNGHTNLLKPLVDAGADLRHETTGDFTAVHHAADHHHGETAKELVHLGAIPKYNDVEGLVYKCNIKGVEIAREIGANFNGRGFWHRLSLLHVAAIQGDNRMVNWLLKFGYPVDIRDKFNWTPLHHAVRCRVLHTIKHLLKKGADINARVTDCRTPLSLARFYRYAAVTEFLISEGAIQ